MVFILVCEIITFYIVRIMANTGARSIIIKYNIVTIIVIIIIIIMIIIKPFVCFSGGAHANFRRVTFEVFPKG